MLITARLEKTNIMGFVELDTDLTSLKLTFLHLKMDDWKTHLSEFGASLAYFQVLWFVF